MKFLALMQEGANEALKNLMHSMHSMYSTRETFQRIFRILKSSFVPVNIFLLVEKFFHIWKNKAMASTNLTQQDRAKTLAGFVIGASQKFEKFVGQAIHAADFYGEIKP